MAFRTLPARPRSTIFAGAPPRHRWWPVLGLLLAASLARGAGFGFDDVARDAAALAAAPWRPPPAAGDGRLAALGYDDLRRLRFRPARALWRGTGSPFEVQFFPLGRLHTRPVEMLEIVAGVPRPIVLPADAFDDDGLGLPALAAEGVAGWRLHHDLHASGYRDEVLAFLGASYFRAVAAGLRYGLSARALAVDTVGGRGEEFPAFVRFWLQRPAAGDAEMRFLALLDGPRVAGAYAFAVRPGTTTTIEVRCRLFLRAPVAMLGLAPLTSMFLSGENQPAAGDFRPEVHDSDGLLVHTGEGERLWRPLLDPKGVFVTSFASRGLRGFGLLQRDRDFGHYEDTEARYELRPGAWVEPIGDWGAGRVELLQFATPDETHDNIAAYWVPAVPPRPGVPFDAAWRLQVAAEPDAGSPLARVVQSRRGHGWREPPPPPSRLQFHLDFAGPVLDGLKAGEVAAVVSGNDNLRDLRVVAYPHPVRGGWRVTLEFDRVDAHRAVELRAFLRQGERALSETWSYALAPE